MNWQKEAGISPATVLKLENDPDASPHPATIRKLTEALGVEPGDVLRD